MTTAAKDMGVGDSAVPMQMDVTQESQWAEAVKLAVDKFGRLDILVNNGVYHLTCYA